MGEVERGCIGDRPGIIAFDNFSDGNSKARVVAGGGQIIQVSTIRSKRSSNEA